MTVTSELTTVVGNTFVVSNPLGDITPTRSQGLFVADTRYLSRYELRVGDAEPILLRSGATGFGEAHVYATNAASESLPPHALEIVRARSLDGRFTEAIEIANLSDVALEVPLTLIVDADFADIFEVRGLGGGRPPRRTVGRAGEAEVVFSHREPGNERQTRVRFSEAPGAMRRGVARFAVSLPPRARWRLDVRVEWVVPRPPTPYPVPVADRLAAPGRGDLPGEAPRLETDDADLARAWERALRDLAALEIPLDSGHVVPAAGLPWFLAIFGRDAIVASWQTFLLGPRAAQGTLEALAAYQAEADDAFRDAEPGKIPHEIRFGELAVSGAIPHAAYYGSIDATPLWVALLGEYLRWTGDLALVERLLPAAERAVAWIDRHGDLDGDGLLEYRRRSSWGLENQGWKDSSDSVRFADGRLAEPPIALVEVQGYAYAAKQTLADLYETVGRVEDGARLRAEARELRRRIHDAFWLPREGYYALALDGRKRPVDSVTSNPGHLLWAGAVEEPYAGMVAERLLAPDLFTGWGVRTMSAEMAAYSPISYHNGSVWPHDNALIVAGLRRYGYDVAASALAEGLIAATRWFDEHRLPELFCGYDRRRTPFPVNYPVACAPQAWAAGSVVLLVQELAGIRPGEGGIAGRPLPQDRTLALRGVPWRGQRYDVRVPGR